MYTKKKRKYRNFIYVLMGIVLCVLIITMFWPEPVENVTSVNNDAPVQFNEEKQIPKVNHQNPIMKDNESETMEGDLPDINAEQETYYLVKLVDNVIKVFFVNVDGQEIELETSEILYDLLSSEDQELFKNGFRVNNQEELYSLLQDFES